MLRLVIHVRSFICLLLEFLKFNCQSLDINLALRTERWQGCQIFLFRHLQFLLGLKSLLFIWRLGQFRWFNNFRLVLTDDCDNIWPWFWDHHILTLGLLDLVIEIVLRISNHYYFDKFSLLDPAFFGLWLLQEKVDHLCILSWIQLDLGELATFCIQSLRGWCNS